MTDIATQAGTEDVTPHDRLVRTLRDAGIHVHQPGAAPLFTPVPQPTMQPMHWRWADLEGYLEELGRVVDLEVGGARRTLRLANPGLESGTTPTFWVSIQYINPGEIASAHRHTASALRFIMRGSGCSTTVDGEEYSMSEGDLVLTPSWTWHDHTHHGDEPMIWMDVLDISLMRSLNNVFFENFGERDQPITEQPQRSWREFGSGVMRPVGPAPRPRVNPLLLYSREQTMAALEQAKVLAPDACDDVILEFQDPTSGEPAVPSLGTKAQLIRPGFVGAHHRHSGSKVYWVIEGSGTSKINGTQFNWTRGDFFSVPPWAVVQHSNPYDVEARLFRVDDSALLHKLNAYHEEILDSEGEGGR
jgi:gentisate 1,2-dioxygenase